MINIIYILTVTNMAIRDDGAKLWGYVVQNSRGA
jgi:hypothetical protein